MAVYKRNYQAYGGALTPPWSRPLVLTRYSLEDLFSMRITVGLLALCMLPTLFGVAVIYISNSQTAQMLLAVGNRNLLAIDNDFFLRIMQGQGWLALLLAAWSGPLLVAADLSNGALPLLLSRPLSRSEYLLGKASVLVVLLSAVTWLPSLFLFVLQASMAKDNWLAANLWIAGAMVLSSLVWIAFLCLLAMAVSAWVRWRIVASATMFAVFFVGAGLAHVVNAVMRTRWGYVLDLHYVVTLIWSDLFGAPVRFRFTQPFSAWVAWVTVLAVTLVCFLLLNRKLRAREVVRG